MRRLLSINIGTPREIGSIRGKRVFSGIYKEPAEGSVIVRKLNLDGDQQADLSVHGGEDKAVYVYPSENYSYWKGKFPDMKMPWGTFGENFTTEGLLENSVHIGDQMKIGSAEFVVTKPRFPCYKLGLKFGTQRMLKMFLESRRAGFYVRVFKEGKSKAGDRITIVKENPDSETIKSIVDSFIETESEQ
jgi:MOSC domain-containing protein YiiM